MRYIRSEDPRSEQWQLLAQFAYAQNVSRYFDERGRTADNSTVDTVVGGFQQAEEYFASSRSVSLHIQPLLLYYGATSLLTAGAALLKDTPLDIRHHGASLGYDVTPGNERGDDTVEKREPTRWETPAAGDTSTKQVPANNTRTRDQSDSRAVARVIANYTATPVNAEHGAVPLFADCFSNGIVLCGTGAWSICDVFSSVPDLKFEFEQCYEKPARVVPVEVFTDENGTQVERIKQTSLVRLRDADQVLLDIPQFARTYHKPQFLDSGWVILNRKLQAPDLTIHSPMGGLYLLLPHQRARKLVVVSPLVTMFMGLYILGMVSRYESPIWSKFVRTDSTGERHLVQRYLSICERQIPNLVLNRILGEEILFTPR